MREAQSRGAEEPVLLNQEGFLAEGASTNVFLARGGTLFTPPLSAGILAGITREVVLELLPGLGIPFREEPLHLDDLLAADEAFMTSTTREVVPVRQVDETPVGERPAGPAHAARDGGLRRLRARALRSGGPHCRRHPVRPNHRLSSSRGTRTIVGRPWGQSVGCAVRKTSRTIEPICSTLRGWPARTAEWQARVAARRSRVPATAQSAASRSFRSRSTRSRAGPGSRVPRIAGTARRRVAPPPNGSTS